jgi:acetoacetyl-CoA synthetase
VTDTALLFRSVRAARSWVQRSGGGVPPVAGCVLMKQGGDGPPLFMIPGAAGSVLQLAPLADAMPGSMPVYAVRPRGMAEQEHPCETVQEMAQHAVAVMTAACPQGPYPLVGYSAGGLVALEAAAQLAAAGREVPLVVLLDTYPSRETWPLACHLEILGRQAFRALEELRRCTLRQAAAEASRRFRSLLHYVAASGLRLVAPPPIVAEGTDAASRRVHLATYNAGEAYRPVRYGGAVVFLQPEEVPNLEPRRPERVWGQFLDNLSIRRVPGSHLRMLEQGAAATAAEIGRCLVDARSGYLDRPPADILHRVGTAPAG